MYKVVNGQLVAAPQTYQDGKKIITNFDKSEELQKAYGYKRLVDGEIPEYDPETEEIFIDKYVYEEIEEEVVIMSVYAVRPIPEPEPIPEPKPTLEERVITMEEEITNTQIAVAEVFELIEGGV